MAIAFRYAKGRDDMRVFLIAVLATIILAVGSVFALNIAQRTSGAVFTTEGARINPAWTAAQADFQVS